MTDFSKNRVLALYKILMKYTDEQHQIAMQDILWHMESEGYSCSEDSIRRYIKQLRNELGVDVISGRGRNASYFIILIEKKYGDVSMIHIIRQILYLTQLHVGSTQKMRLPITTGYADKICKNREFVPEGRVENKLFFL